MQLLLVLFSTATSFLMLSTAQAQHRINESITTPVVPAYRSQQAPHVGVFGGVASPEGRGTSTPEIGLDIGYQPYIPIGMGAEISYMDRAGMDNNRSRTMVLVKGSYNFTGDRSIVRYSYVGVGVGGSFQTGVANLVTAPTIGFDVPLRGETRDEFLSLGANAKYAFIGGGEPDILSITGVVKFWY